MNDITLGQYIYGTSLIHRLDPRIKIVATIAMMVAIFFIQNFVGFAIAAAFLCIIIMISQIPFKMVIRSLRPLMWILIFTFVLNVLFTVDGKPIFELGFIHITAGGLQHGIKMSLRIMLLVMSSSLLTFTTTPMSMTDAIERLLSPLAKIRFPVHELAMIMTIALSMIPTLLEESNKIIKAQMARGADFESGNVIHRVKAMIPILIPLFVSSFRRADELAMAMESRCYHGGEGRTRMKVLHLHWIDLYAMLSIVALFVLIFIWGR